MKCYIFPNVYQPMYEMASLHGLSFQENSSEEHV